MNRYEGSPAIVIERRKGTPDSPFSDMNESLVVASDGKVVLTEIPNELNRVIVTSDDNTTFYEITNGQVPLNGFKVDYINKLVTFNIANAGKQLHFKYFGEGNHYYSLHSIYTKLEEGSVVETLGNLIENGTDALDALDKLDEKLNEVTQATDNAITATNDTRNVIIEGNQIIDTANTKIASMDSKIDEVTSKITELDSELDEARTTIMDVQQKSTVIEGIIADGQDVINNAQLLIDEVKSVGIFNLATSYKKNNTVLDKGSTWIALQDTQNNPLPILPVTENMYWRLIALHGSKGDTGAALSIQGSLTDPSQLPSTGQAGQAYTVNGELYVWSENLDAWENVGNVKGEDGLSAYEVAVNSGYVGTIEEWLASLKGEKGDNGQDADLTEVNQEIANLQQTVTDNQQVVNAHLAQSKKKVYTKSVNEMEPLVSFYLDDGYQNDYDIVLPKAKQLGIPLTICLFNQSELVSTPERLNELANGYGWEFDAHTANHVSLENLTLSQQEEEMRSNIDFFKNMGHHLKGICYPFGFTNEFTMKAARGIFNYGLGSSSSINSTPIDTYDIKRVLTDSNDLATMKDMVNKIKADGEGWIVFYSHSNIFGSNVEVRDKYFEMMDYVKNSGVESVTVSKAMETYSNTLDIGDFKYAEGHFKIGANAKVDSTSIPILVDVDNEAINTRPGTSYDGDKISINRFKIGEPSDIPFDNGIGTLITDRLMEHYGNVGANARQEFYGYLGTSITRYFSGGMWTDWESIGQLNTVKNKPFNNASPITDFSYGKVTQIPLYSGDAPDFPAGGIGTLEVSRVAVNDILNFQTFYPYNSDITYRRRWTASGWTPWVKYIPSTVTITSVLNFGTIQPNSSYSVDVSVSDLSVYDAITVNASYGIIDGIVINSYIVASNTVRIRAFNLTTSPIELSRSFNIGVIKE